MQADDEQTRYDGPAQETNTRARWRWPGEQSQTANEHGEQSEQPEQTLFERHIQIEVMAIGKQGHPYAKHVARIQAAECSQAATGVWKIADQAEGVVRQFVPARRIRHASGE